MTGRAAAKRTAPKLPHTIRVGPKQGGKKLGDLSRQVYPYPAVYLYYTRGLPTDTTDPIIRLPYA